MRSYSPALELSEDLAIGYSQPLARASEKIHLSAGTHFLLGRNGRGKTTLLRTIAESVRPLSGRIQTQGSLRFLPENLRFDDSLTSEDILNSLIPRDRRSAATDLGQRSELDLQKPYGRLSTGNRRKLHLLVAEFSIPADHPALLLLDEPFSGLDAHARAAFESHWHNESPAILRLVSCHPDYDAMPMASALIIHDQNLCHTTNDSQTWSELKFLLN
jgi:ABC-type multidrug transport system ATPase subunit